MVELTDRDIKKAYKNIFDSAPKQTEIDEIKRSQEYWGTNSREVAEKLIESTRFQNMEKTREHTARIFSVFLGREPQEDELNEIMNNQDFWGDNLGSFAHGLTRTKSYSDNPTLSLVDIPDEVDANVGGNTSGGRRPVGQSSERDIQAKRREEARASKNKKLEQDLKGIGLDDEDINNLSQDEKEFLGVVGSKMLKNVEEGTPAPTTFTPETFDNLYEEAMNDEHIKEHYQGVTARVKEQFVDQVAQIQEDFEFQARRQARKFGEETEQLQRELEESGQLYSKTREEEEQEMNTRKQDVIRSTRSNAKRRLDKAQKQLQEKIGTEKANNVASQVSVNKKMLEGINSQEFAQDLTEQGNIEAEGYANTITGEQSQVGQDKFDNQIKEYQNRLRDLDTLANPNQSRSR
jgi:hypothetical protein